ncbi:endolytic transglycosylase MltG [Peptoniphilus sp. SGI.035]|uniref:endolytic transglycosylase MltG n=1 Tax=Peptoniphilus sp. SGI.035 TaxID=3420564 RepID=UPI003D06BDC0
MNNFNRGKLFFIKFLQVLLSILFFLALVFVIKWRIDSLYLNSISNRKVQLSIVDEFTKTANEILVATGLKDEKSVKPIVALDEGKEENEDDDNTKAKITIPEGTNVDGLGEILMSKGLIKDLNAYKALVDDMQIGNKIVPGTYDLNKGLKVREILAKISNTNLKTYNININEGATPADVAKTLMDNGVIVSQQAFVDSCNNLGVTAFAPGTHEILMPSKVANIIKSLAKN